MNPTKEERMKMAFESWLMNHEAANTERWARLTVVEMQHLATWYWEEFKKELDHYLEQ